MSRYLLVLLVVWVLGPLVIFAEWEQPSNLATWSELDGVVAERYASLTNEAFIYPPGNFRFGVPCGRFTFAPEEELAEVTNWIAPTLQYGVPVWHLTVVETATVARAWWYAGADGAYFRTNAAPAALDAWQWVRDVYRDGPPAYLTGSEIDDWYAARARDRIGLGLTLIASNDWPTLLAALDAAATNNPPPGTPPLALPADTNRLAIASAQTSAGALALFLYTPVDKLPTDILTRPALGLTTNGWLIHSSFFPAVPFDAWRTVLSAGSGFFMAARCDLDTDADGIPDDRELYVLGTDRQLWDSAGLTLGDFARLYVYGLAPLRRDSNDDGMDDDEAILRGLNPVTANANVGAATIRYLHDADDRLTGVFTTDAGGVGGGAARYIPSPAHNTLAVSERSAP